MDENNDQNKSSKDGPRLKVVPIKPPKPSTVGEQLLFIGNMMKEFVDDPADAHLMVIFHCETNTATWSYGPDKPPIWALGAIELFKQYLLECMSYPEDE